MTRTQNKSLRTVRANDASPRRSDHWSQAVVFPCGQHEKYACRVIYCPVVDFSVLCDQWHGASLVLMGRVCCSSEGREERQQLLSIVLSLVTGGTVSLWHVQHCHRPHAHRHRLLGEPHLLEVSSLVLRTAERPSGGWTGGGGRPPVSGEMLTPVWEISVCCPLLSGVSDVLYLLPARWTISASTPSAGPDRGTSRYWQSAVTSSPPTRGSASPSITSTRTLC